MAGQLVGLHGGADRRPPGPDRAGVADTCRRTARPPARMTGMRVEPPTSTTPSTSPPRVRHRERSRQMPSVFVHQRIRVLRDQRRGESRPALLASRVQLAPSTTMSVGRCSCRQRLLGARVAFIRRAARDGDRHPPVRGARPQLVAAQKSSASSWSKSSPPSSDIAGGARSPRTRRASDRRMDRSKVPPPRS